MAKVNTEMNYDSEEDILFLSRSRKIKASIEIGDFIIDIDYKGFIAGLEVINASQNLNLSEEELSSMKETAMRVTYKPGVVTLYLIMHFKNQENAVTIPLPVDLGHGSMKLEREVFAVATT